MIKLLLGEITLTTAKKQESLMVRICVETILIYRIRQYIWI